MSAFKSHKRKLSGNQAESPDSPKNLKLEKSFVTPNKTPKNQNKKTPKNSSQQKTPQQFTPAAKSANKKTPNHPDTPYPKLQMFKGTAKLDLDTPNQVAKANNTPKKEPKTPIITTETAASNELKKNRHQKRRVVGKEKRRERRNKFNDLKTKTIQGDEIAKEEVQRRITEIESHGTLSKTKKRKLAVLKRILGGPGKNLVALQPNRNKDAGKVNKKKEASAVTIKDESGTKKKNIKNKQQNGKKQPVIEEISDDDASKDDDDAEDDVVVSDDDEVESENEGDGVSSDDDDASDDNDAEDDDEDEGSDEDSEENEVEPVKKPVKIQKGNDNQKQGKQKDKPNTQQAPQKSQGGNPSQKSSRYVVFVGNLAYVSTEGEIREHFKKVGDIVDVRIPTSQDKKPRGFAYLELKNEEGYQKALSLHNTFLGGRRINVLYSEGGKKKSGDQKSQMKAKNFKLQAMRKQGQLQGSVKHDQKRSVRRAKNKQKET